MVGLPSHQRYCLGFFKSSKYFFNPPITSFCQSFNDVYKVHYALLILVILLNKLGLSSAKFSKA